MSWTNDMELARILASFQAAGKHTLEHRLTGYVKPLFGETTANCFAVFSVAHPSATMCEATGCTFEWSQVFDIFIHYTANASALTFSDMLYWGRVDAATYTWDHSPPDLCLYMHQTAISFPSVGVVYFVTKDQLSIGGVPFDAAVARGGTRG